MFCQPMPNSIELWKARWLRGWLTHGRSLWLRHSNPNTNPNNNPNLIIDSKLQRTPAELVQSDDYNRASLATSPPLSFEDHKNK